MSSTEERLLTVALLPGSRTSKEPGKCSPSAPLRTCEKVAPGKNRLIYLWGHLTAVHDAMLPLLGLGPRLHPELDVPFVTRPDKSVPDLPSADEVKKAWEEVNGKLASEFASFPPIGCKNILQSLTRTSLRIHCVTASPSYSAAPTISPSISARRPYFRNNPEILE